MIYKYLNMSQTTERLDVILKHSNDVLIYKNRLKHNQTFFFGRLREHNTYSYVQASKLQILLKVKKVILYHDLL